MHGGGSPMHWRRSMLPDPDAWLHVAGLRVTAAALVTAGLLALVLAGWLLRAAGFGCCP